MEREQVVQKCFEALESRNFTEARRYIADDLKYNGDLPERLGKKEFVDLQENLMKAIPDWKYNAHDYRTHGDTVECKIQITGTNTSSVSSFAPGMPGIPVTGKHVSLPEETWHITVENDKITRIESKSIAGGGVMGLLKQLGVQIPGQTRK